MASKTAFLRKHAWLAWWGQDCRNERISPQNLINLVPGVYSIVSSRLAHIQQVTSSDCLIHKDSDQSNCRSLSAEPWSSEGSSRKRLATRSSWGAAKHPGGWLWPNRFGNLNSGGSGFWGTMTGFYMNFTSWNKFIYNSVNILTIRICIDNIEPYCNHIAIWHPEFIKISVECCPLGCNRSSGSAWLGLATQAMNSKRQMFAGPCSRLPVEATQWVNPTEQLHWVGGDCSKMFKKRVWEERQQLNLCEKCGSSSIGMSSLNLIWRGNLSRSFVGSSLILIVSLLAVFYT